jgi:hypothetical protein
MTVFKNDGSWYFLGKRNKLTVYVKMGSCIYVDNYGNIVPSPEEQEMIELTNKRIKRQLKR